MDKILGLFSQMAPEKALAEITKVLGRFLQDLDHDARERFLINLIEQSGGDKVSGMVHLWLAECMGEGVDPTQMCQGLVNKIARSEQLLAIADPDLLVLFEDWLEELEGEVRSVLENNEAMDADQLAGKLGLSRRGATFLLSKIERERI